MKHILVTGGAGYIGSHTIVELCKKGYTPIIIDNFRNSKPFILKNLNELTGQNIHYFSIDICDKKELFAQLKSVQVDGIIHFAADKAVGESVKNPLKYYSNNVIGLINILEWAVENQVKHFIFSSSCTVYGEPQDVKEVDEQSPYQHATSPYGNTKIIGEQIIHDLQKQYQQGNFLSLRYFNPIGAHPSGFIGELPLGKPNNLLPFITQTAIGKIKQLTVFGKDYNTPDGTCIRDYIHVVDLAKAHVKGMDFLLKSKLNAVEYINIGSGRGYSVLEIIQTFEQETQQALNWTFGEKRPGDIAQIYANVQKAEQQLDWRANLSIKDAVKDAWNWELKLKEMNF